MKAELKNGKLYLEIEVNDPPARSASGKSLVVASTQGNVSTAVIVQGKPLTVGLNAYIKA